MPARPWSWLFEAALTRRRGRSQRGQGGWRQPGREPLGVECLESDQESMMPLRSWPRWMDVVRLSQALWTGLDPLAGSSTRHRCRPGLETLESRLAPAGHDTLHTAIPLTLSGTQPAQVSGSLVAPNQVDLYAVQLAAGDEVAADVSALTPGSPEAALRVFDSSGRQLAFQENQGGSPDTQLTFDALGSGVYYVGVSSNGDYLYDPNTSGSGTGGLSTGSYALTLTQTSGAILTQESPGNDTLQTAQPISGNVDGSITGQRVVQGTYVNGTTQYYQFTAAETGGLNATVTPSDGTVLLPRLALYSDTGRLLIQSDAVGPAQASAQLKQQLQPGTYYLGVSAVRDSASSSEGQSYLLATTFDPALPPFQLLPVGGHPSSVAVGDFTHDGNLGIVTANQGAFDQATSTFGPGTVSVLLGRGDGTFLSAVSYAVGSFPASVAVGDFNHDGNPDIVTANQGAYDPITGTLGPSTVSVLLGRGDGTFLPAVSSSVGSDPNSVAVGDFNHDGNLDIVTANQGAFDPATNTFAGTVSVLLGRGDGTFLPAVSYSVGSDPKTVAVGDFNHDGNLDIATANQGDNTVSVLLGNGDGTFLPAVSYPVGNDSIVVVDVTHVGSTPFTLVVGDFTHDGNLDIVTANYTVNPVTGLADNTVSVLQGRGDGTFLPAVSYPVGSDLGPAAVGDFNNDGNLDIVTANQGNTVSVLQGRGDGTFLPAVSYSVGSEPNSVAVGDFTRDGNLDIVTANDGASTVSVLLGRGDGTFLPAVSYSVGSEPNSVAVGDFNHDGNLDIVTANIGDGTVSVLQGRGDGTFLPAVSYSVGSGPSSVAVGDFNHDGNPDIVTANSTFNPVTGLADNTVSVLLGRGDGTFLSAVSYAVGSFPESVAVGDFNHDGNPDIVTANAEDVTVSVLLGRGDGTFLPAVSYSVGSDPYSVAVGDFNHDGNLDITTAAGDGMSVLLGNGDGTFLPAVSYSVGNEPSSSVAVGDFNHDGNLDIINANQFDSTVSVFLGRGDGTFLPAVSYSVGSGPSSVAAGGVTVAVGDFTHDGNLDIVTANQDNTVSVLQGRGDGTFLPAVSYSVAGDPNSVAVGDFNHDGNLDLTTANIGANTVSVLLGEGNGQFQTATPDTGITLRNIPFLQDLTGDGILDSLILNSSGALLFRQGLPTTGEFAPPVIINPDHPARDATVFRTATGWAVAAVDDAGNTVSLYTWDPATHSFQRNIAFATGNLPVRIAAADLTGQEVQGQPLDDLVVANDFDHSVTIAVQQPDGTFTTLTRTIGVGPSDITCADLGGPDGPDIVVSDQVSGDFSVLYNDSSHSFSRQSRYRAGTGLFDITLDPNTGEQTVLSQLQTVGLVTGSFTPARSEDHVDDLVVLNPAAKSFTLLPNQGQGRFTDPQPGNTYFPTSAQPSQIANLTLPGDTLPSVAILMEDLGQIWIYRNNGDGTFATPIKVDAGNDPSGFSVATVNGKPALLVGNAFGDILTLLYDGQGGFAPDRADLQHVPLAVGKIALTGQQFAVVANENEDRVSLYYLSGDGQVSSPIAVTGKLPLLAPGAVGTFTVNDDPNPYLVVAYNLSNKVVVSHYDPMVGQFTQLETYAVGNNPVSVTVADVNSDGVPDLLVANQGSNDVSVLIGSITKGLWTATPYQRLSSGGLGPIAVTVQPSGGPNGPNLEVTNSDGQVFMLPGIGSGGQGSGFFQDTPQLVVDTGQTIVQAVPDPSTGGSFLVGSNGSVGVLTGDSFTPIVTAQPGQINALGTLPDGDLVAALQGGTVEMLHLNSATGLYNVAGTLTLLGGGSGPLDPSALAVLPTDTGFEVLVTNEGDDQLFAFGLTSPVPPPVEPPSNPEPDNPEPPDNPASTVMGPTGPVFPVIPGDDNTLPAFNAAQSEGGSQRPQSADLQPVDNADLALAATLRTGTADDLPGNEDGSGSGGGFVVGLDSSGLGRAVTALLVGVQEGGPDDANAEPGQAAGDQADAAEADRPPSLTDFLEGVDEGIRELRRDVEPDHHEVDARSLSPETLFAALDSLFAEPAGLAENSGPDSMRQEDWVAALARETLALTAPAPLSRSLQDVPDEVASALGTEPAPTTQVHEVYPVSASLAEAGPPALLSTGLAPVGEVGEALPTFPPVATTPEIPHWDVSASLPAVEPAGAGNIPWEPALVLAGWGHACLRDQAASVWDRKRSPAGPQVTRP